MTKNQKEADWSMNGRKSRPEDIHALNSVAKAFGLPVEYVPGPDQSIIKVQIPDTPELAAKRIKAGNWPFSS